MARVARRAEMALGRSRRDPVARFRHVAGDPGVARLVWTNETESAEIVEVTEVQCREDKENPREANRERGWLRLRDVMVV